MGKDQALIPDMRYYGNRLNRDEYFVACENKKSLLR